MADLGNGQSPIDISDWNESREAVPEFAYCTDASRVELVQGLPMIHFNRGSELSLGKERFRLLQLHWHTPAEHTIAAEEFDAEVHFVTSIRGTNCSSSASSTSLATGTRACNRSSIKPLRPVRSTALSPPSRRPTTYRNRTASITTPAHSPQRPSVSQSSGTCRGRLRPSRNDRSSSSRP